MTIFSSRVTGFPKRLKLLELNNLKLEKKLSATWSNQPGKIVLAAGQIAQCVYLPLAQAHEMFCLNLFKVYLMTVVTGTLLLNMQRTHPMTSSSR